MATIVATTAIVACHASGAAAIGLTSASVTPTDPRAGARSDVRIDVRIANPQDDVSDLTLELPPGLLGNPNAADRCTEDALRRDACPAASAVGTTSVDAVANFLVPIPITAPGTVYNVAPPDGEPARLGIVVRPVGGILGKVTLVAKVAVRDEADYGLTATIAGIPNTLTGIALDIRGLSLTLSRSFMTNPTSCAPATSRVTIAGRAGGPASASSTQTPTDCAGVPFAPTLGSAAADPRADVPSAYTVTLGQPADVDGRQPSHVRRAQIVTPPGVTLNPALAPGLVVCDDAAFGAQGDPAVACPAASRIGTVALDTPLLGTLPGTVYFGRTAARPYRLLVVAQGSGVVVKLEGEVVPDPATGQLTTTFDGLPQVPFTRFALTFDGGDRSVLATPETCGTATATATVRPFSGTADQTPTGAQQITGCPTAIAPALAAARSTEAAKADTALALDLVRPAGSGVPSDLRVTLPAGQLGRILAVPPCPDDAIAAGACPPESRIGSVTTTIGSGPATVDLQGTAFLAGGGGTSLARIVLVVPATVGPIALGTFVLPTALDLEPLSGRVTVSASLPKAFNGIPLRLRRLQLAIDRPGLLFNPTGCEERPVQATLSGNGLTGAATAPTRATGCEGLPFDPTIRASVPSAKARTFGDEVPLRVQLTKLDTGAALREAQVAIPNALRAQVAALSVVCQADQLAAGQCPAGSQIGTAYARTPLLPFPLQGPVVLAQTGDVPPQRGGLSLPYAVANLRGGPVALRVEGQLKLDRAGRLSARFAGLPDVPLDEFRLDFEGRAFKSQEDLCSTTRGPAQATLGAQSGATRERGVPIEVAACGRRAAVRMRVRGLASGRPTGRVRVDSSPVAGKLTRTEIRLPAALRPTGRRAQVRVRADGKRLGARSWRITRSGRVTVRTRRGAERIDVVLRRGSVRTTGKARRRAARLLRFDRAATTRLTVGLRGTDSVERRPLRVRFDALVRR